MSGKTSKKNIFINDTEKKIFYIIYRENSKTEENFKNLYQKPYKTETLPSFSNDIIDTIKKFTKVVFCYSLKNSTEVKPNQDIKSYFNLVEEGEETTGHLFLHKIAKYNENHPKQPAEKKPKTRTKKDKSTATVVRKSTKNSKKKTEEEVKTDEKKEETKKEDDKKEEIKKDEKKDEIKKEEKKEEVKKDEIKKEETKKEEIKKEENKKEEKKDEIKKDEVKKEEKIDEKKEETKPNASETKKKGTRRGKIKELNDMATQVDK